MGARIDPTRTIVLRTQFSQDMSKRFLLLTYALVTLIEEEDALGLKVNAPMVLAASLVEGSTSPVITQLAERQQWRFRSNPDKVEAFRRWLQDQIDKGILSGKDLKGMPWLGKYVTAAYKKGKTRAYDDVQRKRGAKDPRVTFGAKQEFLRAVEMDSATAAKVMLLATRAYEDLRGVTATMASQMVKALTNGLLEGKSPRVIARNMTKMVKGITKSRALAIARDSIIHAHAEGQLDAFESLGVKGVGVYAEWSTAGDDRVCGQCQPLEGAILTIQEARGLLPRHSNCRCSFRPEDDVDTKNRKRTLIRKLKKSIGRGVTDWPGRKLIPRKSKGKKGKAKKPRGKRRR